MGKGGIHPSKQNGGSSSKTGNVNGSKQSTTKGGGTKGSPQAGK